MRNCRLLRTRWIQCLPVYGKLLVQSVALCLLVNLKQNYLRNCFQVLGDCRENMRAIERRQDVISQVLVNHLLGFITYKRRYICHLYFVFYSKYINFIFNKCWNIKFQLIEFPNFWSSIRTINTYFTLAELEFLKIKKEISHQLSESNISRVKLPNGQNFTQTINPNRGEIFQNEHKLIFIFNQESQTKISHD